jgi:hypothetical protein
MAIDKAGADWVGGDIRRARAAARVDLFRTPQWTVCFTGTRPPR